MVILDHLYSCRFGTFLYNCESARESNVRNNKQTHTYTSQTIGVVFNHINMQTLIVLPTLNISKVLYLIMQSVIIYIYFFFLLILLRATEWWPSRDSGAKSVWQAENACFLHFSHLKNVFFFSAATYTLIDLSWIEKLILIQNVF